MKKTAKTLLLSLLLTATAVPAFAFSDTTSDTNAIKIDSLQHSGILSGQPGGKFNPQSPMTFSAGVSAIVKGFNLSLAAFTFDKAPQASEQFPNLKDNVWYSDAFVIAAANGLDIPKDVQPNEPMSRELFVHLLSQAINLNGNFPTILRFNHVADEASLTPAYISSVQHLLNIGVSLLDKNDSFQPKQAITRSTAAGWLYDTTEYVARMKDKESSSPVNTASPLTDYHLSSVKVNDKISEVTISATAPTPGYALKVTSIVFEGSKALITTEVNKPDPEAIVAQVLTEIKTTTYIPAGYTPVFANQDLNDSETSAVK